MMWGGATSKSQRMYGVMRWSDVSKTKRRECSRPKRWTGDSSLPMVLEGSSLPESPDGPVEGREFVKRSLTSN